MKIVAIVGTGSGCGKTTVACAVLRAIPGLGAIKISPRGGESRVEWGAGEPGKDTDRYVGSGAVRVARIIGPRDEVVSRWELIKDQFEDCQGVVVEGASALNIPGDLLVIYVVGDTPKEKRIEQNRAVAAKSTIIIERSSHSGIELSMHAVRTFLSGSSLE